METGSLVTTDNKEDRNIMALIQAGGILFGFLPALIVYLIYPFFSHPPSLLD